MTEKEQQEHEAAIKTIAILKGELNLVRLALKNEQSFSKELAAENTHLRERVLGAVHQFGPRERLQIEICPSAFFMYPTDKRQEYVEETVIDAVRRLMHIYSGAEHLERLRRKVRV